MNSLQLELTEERRAIIKAIIDDGCMEINGNKYEIMKFNHKTRLEILEFIHKMDSGLEMIGGNGWQFAEKTMSSRITFNGMQVSKLKEHWEEHAADYMTYMEYALQVVAFPFLSGKRTG